LNSHLIHLIGTLPIVYIHTITSSINNYNNSNTPTCKYQTCIYTSICNPTHHVKLFYIITLKEFLTSYHKEKRCNKSLENIFLLPPFFSSKTIRSQYKILRIFFLFNPSPNTPRSYNLAFFFVLIVSLQGFLHNFSLLFLSLYDRLGMVLGKHYSLIYIYNFSLITLMVYAFFFINSTSTPCLFFH